MVGGHTQIVLDVSGAMATLSECSSIGWERWAVPWCNPQGSGPSCVASCIGRHAVLVHVPLRANVEDVALEEDEFEERDDAKGDMDEDGRRPAVVIRHCLGVCVCLALLLLLVLVGLAGGHGVPEVLDGVPPGTCCSRHETEQQEEAYETPYVDAGECPRAGFLRLGLAAAAAAAGGSSSVGLRT